MVARMAKIANARQKRRAKGSQVRFGIDRGREDRLVREFQSTGDEKVFLQIYEPRLPTFQHLAKRYRYLGEDMESEVRTVFVRAVRGYGVGRKSAPSFNTYFYTSFLNHVKNIMKAKSRDKRRLIDGSDPEASTVSLDESTGQHKNESQTYHEVVGSGVNMFRAISMRDPIRRVGRQSWILLDFMLEAAATGIRSVRSRQFSRKIRLTGRRRLEAAVREDVGLPETAYHIDKMESIKRRASYTVTVNGKAVTDLLAKLLQEENEKNQGSKGQGCGRVV